MTRKQLAEALDVDPRTIFKFAESGMPVAKPGRPGKATLYDLDAVKAWREAQLEARQAGGLDPAQERARKDRAAALLAEQMYQARAKELLPADDVARVWSRHISAVRSKLLSVPGVWADRVHRAARGRVHDVERVLDDAVRDVLTELADGKADQEYAEQLEAAKPKPKRRPR